MEPTPYDSIFACLPCGLCVVDGGGRILSMNPALEQFLGQRLTDWSGQPLALWLEQAIRDPAQALCWTVALSQALAQGETTYLNLPTDFRTASDAGPSISLTGVAAPWQGSNLEHAGALVLFCDSCSRESQEGTRSRFLAVLAHELGTPVNHLTIAAEQLARRLEASDPDVRRLLQVIQDEANLLQRLCAQFPTLLPAATGSSQPRQRLVPLRPCLRRVAQAFSLRDLDCDIVVQVPSDLPLVWSDAERIQQVLSKLLDNAIRYAPPGSQIVLSAQKQGDEIVVSVQDQGPGVSEEDAETMYEPWHRGSQEEPDAEHQGLGLGLARSLVHSLDGRLWHERPVEGGARFCFSLPRAQAVPDE
jgi:signal transduction histidine kinase